MSSEEGIDLKPEAMYFMVNDYLMAMFHESPDRFKHLLQTIFNLVTEEALISSSKGSNDAKDQTSDDQKQTLATNKLSPTQTVDQFFQDEDEEYIVSSTLSSSSRTVKEQEEQEEVSSNIQEQTDIVVQEQEIINLDRTAEERRKLIQNVLANRSRNFETKYQPISIQEPRKSNRPTSNLPIRQNIVPPAKINTVRTRMDIAKTGLVGKQPIRYDAGLGSVGFHVTGKK